jgi:hypothetical protein
MKGLSILLALLFVGVTAHAETLGGVKMKSQVEVKGENLKLNGMGMRKARIFGIGVEVYVAGLYLSKFEKSASKILKSPGPKMIQIQFLREVSKRKLTGAWSAGVEKNCVKAECAQAKKDVEQFNQFMKDVKEKDKMTLTFLPDAVQVKISGKASSRGVVKSPSFAKVLLSVFIGDEPPNEELKKGLLGGGKPRT